MTGALEHRSDNGMSSRPSFALCRMLSLILALRSARVGHSNSARFLAVLPCVKSKLPVTNRAALFCIFSNSCIWFSW